MKFLGKIDSPYHAVNRQYVDDAVTAGLGTITEIPNEEILSLWEKHMQVSDTSEGGQLLLPLEVSQRVVEHIDLVDIHRSINCPEVVLLADGWVDDTQRVEVEGVTEESKVIIIPDPLCILPYAENIVELTLKENGYLTFTVNTVPEADIVINVLSIE